MIEERYHPISTRHKRAEHELGPYKQVDLLTYLLEHALAPDERTARGLLLGGRVLVNDAPQTSPHFAVPDGAAVRIKGQVDAPVSRGALKLAPAIERSGFNVAGRICLDLGVSTGGFSEVLLKLNAARVYAVDVGYGVTALSVRDDPRVVLLERTNARNLTREHVPEAVERVVGDLSFISWRLVLPAITPLLAHDAELLLLVKPQFEIDPDVRSKLSGGVLDDPREQLGALLGLYDVWASSAMHIAAVLPSALAGAKGNREYFVYLQYGRAATSREEYERMSSQAVAEAQQ